MFKLARHIQRAYDYIFSLTAMSCVFADQNNMGIVSNDRSRLICEPDSVNARLSPQVNQL